MNSLTKQPWALIQADVAPFSTARFAFGPGGGTATLQASAMTPSTPGTSWQFTAYSESSFKEAADLSCASAPDLIGSNGLNSPAVSSTDTIQWTSASTSMWYFGIKEVAPALSCALSDLDGATYTLTVTQANGSQLSWEEQGMPAIYASFFVLMGLALLAHVYGHIIAALPPEYPTSKGFRPPMVNAVLVSLAFHTISNLFHLIEWSVVATTGMDSGLFLSVLGGLLRLLALATIWVMAAFVATGYGVTTKRIALMENNNWRGALLLGVVVVLGLTATIIYGTASRNPGNSSLAAAGAIGITVTLFLMGYLAWFWRATLQIIAAEVSVPKKGLLQNLLYVTIFTFLSLPFAEIVGE